MPVTLKVKLWSGTPVWLRRRPPTVARLHRRTAAEADVIVIGAGISGALTANVLSEAGLKVVLIDRRGPAKGSSAASTALIQYEIDEPLTRLSRKIGAKSAIRHYRRSKLAVDALVERCNRLGIAADLVPRDSLYLSGNLLGLSGLKAERAAREQAGLETSFLTRPELKELYGLDRAAALRSSGNYAADPIRLTTGFLNAALAGGARLFAPEEVEKVMETRRGIVAMTRSGNLLKARFAVFATGYEIPFNLSRRHHRLMSTWAMATRPQRWTPWPTECLIWEAADPYLYLRTTVDGRVICGGGDEDFKDEATRDALLERKTQFLERKLSRMFPDIDARAAFRWTGTFGVTPTGTPSIGFVPRRRRTLAVLGYGGNGFTFSMIAAQVIRGLILGDGDPDSDLYAPRFD
jgi:glycine/D-amino acid oxidase-like deaminating enzyme